MSYKPEFRTKDRRQQKDMSKLSELEKVFSSSELYFIHIVCKHVITMNDALYFDGVLTGMGKIVAPVNTSLNDEIMFLHNFQLTKIRIATNALLR